MSSEIAPIAKRLREILMNDFGDNQSAFSKEIGMSQPSISRVINGDRPVSQRIIDRVCKKLGYSADWFINGKGTKKAKGDNVKLVTELSMLRAEYNILLNRVDRLEARMKGYEKGHK